MVAISTLEATRGEGAERVAFEVPCLLREEVCIEDVTILACMLVLQEVQAVNIPSDEIGGDDEVVKEAPHISIGQRSFP